MAVPLVSVSISLRSPIRPREGTWNSRRTRPEPWFTIFVILPLRVPSFSITTPTKFSGQSMTSSSSGSCSLPSMVLGQDFRLADRQLVAFAAHHLDQDGELQFAAAHHLEGVRAAGLFHADRDVGQQFLVQPVAQIARGDVLALRGPANGDVLMVNVIAMVGSSIWMCGSGFGSLGAGDGLADGDAFDAGDGQNVARAADGFVHALQAFERVQLGDLGLVDRAVELGDGDFVAVACSVPLKTRPMARRPR